MKNTYSCVIAVLVLAALGPAALASSELRVEGKRFVDRENRTVILRGVNVSGTAKVSPFVTLPGGRTEMLDPLPKWGLNVIRLLFIWEAYEPEAGHYNEAYLEQVAAVAEAAWARGLYVVIDLHQDSFSRFVGGGCGTGFPAWVSGHRAENFPLKDCGTLWALKSAVSASMHKAYTAFYTNRFGGRTGFIELWRRLAHRFREIPGVVGYDLINEPWGDEKKELSPLYEDVARAIRSEDPTAILFLEPVLLTVTGLQRESWLERPHFDNYAYSPHYYDAVAAATQHYFKENPFTDLVFDRMSRKPREWGVPMFLGEFGAYAKTGNVRAYVDHQYEKLDAILGSGAQWNYSPGWTRRGSKTAGTTRTTASSTTRAGCAPTSSRAPTRAKQRALPALSRSRATSAAARFRSVTTGSTTRPPDAA
ncbi:MAG: cellulase family glycosylhydrolase [Deltaproteobacteria bacterium]|nr:cellulase family glycosylhydrolase [Deltaproteobacteria bacterium]